MRNLIAIIVITLLVITPLLVDKRYIVTDQFNSLGNNVWELKSLDSDFMVAWPTDEQFTIGDTISIVN